MPQVPETTVTDMDYQGRDSFSSRSNSTSSTSSEGSTGSAVSAVSADSADSSLSAEGSFQPKSAISSHKYHHHLAPPEEKSGRSRRWSLTGRFFEKRRSNPESVPAPNSFPRQSKLGNGNGNGPYPDSKSESNNSSKRPSLVDFPKALLTSLRRSSLSGAIGSSFSRGSSRERDSKWGCGSNDDDSSDDNDDEASELKKDKEYEKKKAREAEIDVLGLTGGLSNVTLAKLKAPPQSPRRLSLRPQPKSILKKRLSDAIPLEDGDVTSATIANAGNPDGAVPATSLTAETSSSSSSTVAVSQTTSLDVPEMPQATASSPRSSSRASILNSENVHPMASPAKTNPEAVLPYPDHRARLLTHSPKPSHKEAFITPPNEEENEEATASTNDNSNTRATGLPAIDIKTTETAPSAETSTSAPVATGQSSPSKGAAIPLDFTPGMQSNTSRNRTSERSQDMISQDEMLTLEMMSLGARAQDAPVGYYSPMGSRKSSNTEGFGLGLDERGGKRRSINFLDRVEVIPAHRKAVYNRQSDKRATFKVLTPDMKGDIRDELNNYKLREMAVHVESMGNTAFH
ncbi:hypothetical protein BGW38_002446 [Lunasporangiospora selenospora]|uniref:Uncharacterized protein n=1 Tax=Lunasporangiospora selenospora TaxID=979761 RepID=A0A9P6FSR9_9FUNG|nr:hypothetical protein BGW38_002446 [Lunasporangiospora selenospora]